MTDEEIVAALKAHIIDHPEVWGHDIIVRDVIANLKPEVERLREERDEARAEVERLRGEVAMLSDTLGESTATRSRVVKDRDALLAVVRAVAELQPTSVGGFDALRVVTLHPRIALAQLPSTASALVAAHDAAPHD